MSAIVDLPAPDRPVNQIVNPCVSAHIQISLSRKEGKVIQHDVRGARSRPFVEVLQPIGTDRPA